MPRHRVIPPVWIEYLHNLHYLHSESDVIESAQPHDNPHGQLRTVVWKSKPQRVQNIVVQGFGLDLLEGWMDVGFGI